MLPFLAAKTHLPSTPPNLVTRLHLLEALDQCLQPGVQLTLVSAPAGAGKTTLLAQWLRQTQADWKVAWFALDAEDNHLGRFFSYLAAAIEYAIPDFGGNFTALAEANPNFTPDQGIAYLVEQVMDAEQNLLLVFDDYHAITEPEIHQALKLLIDHLPNNMRLVIAGRVEPPLPLARLRARGQLVEIRTADLRFNVQETSDFMGRFGELANFAKQETYLEQLNASTEGWAAGLQMTALALRSEVSHHGGVSAALMERFVRELNGSQRFILDYLLEEVLSRETEPTREFLLHTCLLKRFNPALCVAVMPDITLSAVQELLDYLERANLFVIPLDDGQEWFRYHHLFADVLQKQLLHSHPGLAPELHRRAAHWFNEQGMVDEALHHILLSGDLDLALDLVEKHALVAILQGQIASATRWLDALPSGALLSRPRLCLDRAWALTFTSQTETAFPYLERAAALLGDAPAALAEVWGLRSFSESMYGHPDEAIRLARRALEVVSSETSFVQCCNRLFLAGALAHTGQLDQALQEYRSVQPLLQMNTGLAGLAILEADFLHDLAIFLYGQDSARQARSLLEQAIVRLETSSASCQPAAVFLYVGLGKILLMENQLIEAEQVLEKGLRLDPVAMTVGAFDGWLALWRVKLNQGDFPAARQILHQLEQITQARDPEVIRMVSLNASLQDLLEGQPAPAMESLGWRGTVDDVLARASDSEMMGWRLNEFFTYARLLMARECYADSLKILERLEKATQKTGSLWMTNRARMFQAVAWWQSGQSSRALKILADLLAYTSQMEANPARLYLEPGLAARTLLQEAARRGLHPVHIAQLLAQFPPEPSPIQHPALPDALTARELDVLHLIADGLKNQEICEKLFISLNTVRYHTNNIFGKLGVDNRTAAVARARALNIL